MGKATLTVFVLVSEFADTSDTSCINNWKDIVEECVLVPYKPKDQQALYQKLDGLISKLKYNHYLIVHPELSLDSTLKNSLQNLALEDGVNYRIRQRFSYDDKLYDLNRRYFSIMSVGPSTKKNQTLEGHLITNTSKAIADVILTLQLEAIISNYSSTSENKKWSSLLLNCSHRYLSLLLKHPSLILKNKARYRIGLQAFKPLVQKNKQLKLAHSTWSPHVVFMNTTSHWGGGEKWHFEHAQMVEKKTDANVTLLVSKNSDLANKAKNTDLFLKEIIVRKISFLNPFYIRNMARFLQRKQAHTLLLNGPLDAKIAGISAFFAGVPRVIYRRGLATPTKHSGLNILKFSCLIDEFIVNSNETKRQLFSKIPIQEQELIIHRLYNSVPKNNLTTSSSFDKIRLVNASRLVQQKGLQYLIELGALLKAKKLDFQLLIAGDGPLKSDLQEEIDKRQLNDCIELLGFVEDMKAFMANSDIYVCSSIYEGFGFSIAEAMMAAKPVVGFDTSSNPELIIPDKTGVLVPAFNVNKLADEVYDLSMDADRRQILGESAQRWAHDQFSAEIQEERLLEILGIKHTSPDVL